MLGRTLDGRYRVDSLIGRGGMGAVYKGVQLSTMQVVAIKVIRSEHADDPDAAKRFHREARAASLLKHPHTIRVFDFGESPEGDLYMVLEHLDGRTLSKAIKAEGALPEPRMAKVCGEVARSLAEAHAAGLAHRDLKPDNIMLVGSVGDPDFVKVLDFGVAKFMSGSSSESSVTRSGSVVGTPQYMSPEQARGSRALTPAVDVYALGIIAHQALTGARPFDGDSALDVLMKHVQQPVPELPASLPVSDATRNVVRRMLSKDPADRPPAAEVAAVLDRVRMATWGQATVPRPAVIPPAGPPVAPSLPGPPQPWDADPGATVADPDATVALATPTPGPVPAAQDAPDAGDRGRRAWPFAVALVAAVAVAFGLYVLLGQGSPGAPPGSGPSPVADPAAASAPGIEPSPASAPAPAPDPTPSPAPAPAPAPRETAPVRVRFESSPAGAAVLEGSRQIGVTPFEGLVPGPPGRREYVFRLAGHREGRAAADVREGAVVRADLAREADRAPRPRVGRPPSAPVPGAAPARTPAPAPVPAPTPAKKGFRPLD